MKKSIFNWSGGKDSALGLYHCLNDKDIEIKYLLTTLSEEYRRISMHGVRKELLQLQAENIGIELKEIYLPELASLEIYNGIIKTAFDGFKDEGIEYSIFGDIFLKDLRKYREDKLAEVSMKGLFPLWQRPSTEIIKEFIGLGFRTVIVCVNEKYLDKSFAGRIIDEDLLNDLPGNVDPCGENGEFHTFVFDGPIFKKKIDYELGKIVRREYKAENGNIDNPDNNKKNYNNIFWYRDILFRSAYCSRLS
jgi:uncharacterized protein (TIGR00290 family)